MPWCIPGLVHSGVVGAVEAHGLGAHSHVLPEIPRSSFEVRVNYWPSSIDLMASTPSMRWRERYASGPAHNERGAARTAALIITRATFDSRRGKVTAAGLTAFRLEE